MITKLLLLLKQKIKMKPLLPKTNGERILLAILLLGLLLFLSNVKIATEVCDGSTGQMTIDPNGFVAKHLVYRCEASEPVDDTGQEARVKSLLSANAMEGWEDYTSEINQLHFGDKLKAEIYSNPAFFKKMQLAKPIFFTSYNPEVGQTDSSPCIGANGTDVCAMARAGIRTIALSQELVGRAKHKPYHYGDKVRLYSDNPQCNGVFQVEDTMNARYTKRGDIFQPTRATNTSCWAVVTHYQPNVKLSWKLHDSLSE